MTSTSDDGDALQRERPDPVEDLERADEALQNARRRVQAAGEATLVALRDHLDEFRSLLDRYEERATGSGDFAAFIEFQEKVAGLTDALPEDLPERDTFEDVDDLLQQRRLTEDDFERAREHLDAAERRLRPLKERADAIDSYRRARHELVTRRDHLRDRIDELERLVSLGAADLDAPIERLREPIEAYDRAVSAAFREFRSDRPARAVLDLVETTRLYPLVPFREPPSDLLEYVRAHDAGEESIPQLLEYSEYSRSKLEHYVDDARALQRAVGTQRTYLKRLDAEPLTVGWPPPEADVLRWQCEERISVVGRFAAEVVPTLRTVRDLTRVDEYDHLQESAMARDELTDEERERLKRGSVGEKLEDTRSELRRVEAALEEYPDR